MPERDEPGARIPESRTLTRRHTRVSLVWIVPAVAALAGVWVAVARYLSEGPRITIAFHSAEGLEAGKTKIRYNGVDVGTVTNIVLADDHEQVIATAAMEPKTEDLLVEGTKFWAVRPRISGATISGLSTLISGAYIGLEIGDSRQKKREFVALETPPVITDDVPGRYFVLETPDLGSLDYGTPLFFRRFQVGQVVSYELDPEGKGVHVRVFIHAPYDRFVTPGTRFWNASGVDLQLSASGLSVETESMLSILIGGIAFETPPTNAPEAPAAADTSFILHANRAGAFRPAARHPQTYVLVFQESVRGLVRGAPVEFRGIPIGEVGDIVPEFDAKTSEFIVRVIIHVDPQQLGVKIVDDPTRDLADGRKTIVTTLAARGLRAQLRSGSLLTGALYVALDLFPDAAPATIDWSQEPVQLATVPGQLEGVEAGLASIVRKLNKLPIEQIGEEVKVALADLDRTLLSARGTFDSAGKLVDPSSGLGEQLGGTLQEASRAARAFRVFADYLEQHPEALLRGKSGEAK